MLIKTRIFLNNNKQHYYFLL